jgi:hypothetical protein
MKPIDRLADQLFGADRTTGKVCDVKFFLAENFVSMDDFCEDANEVFALIDSGAIKPTIYKATGGGSK